jgi:CDP-glucose 4,6-dehydratase
MIAAALYQYGPKYSEAWNFGPDDSDCQTVGWLVQHICQMWSPKGQWRLDPGGNPHEAHFLKLDCSNARMSFGWRPKLKLLDALKWTTDWYMQYYKNISLIRAFTENQIVAYQKLELS